jgi:hypothetical protein
MVVRIYVSVLGGRAMPVPTGSMIKLPFFIPIKRNSDSIRTA